MELKRTFRSGVVLLELMAAILIFALAGAVCVRVLMKADEVSARSRNLNDGVNHASSAAELIRAARDEEAVMENFRRAWPQAEVGRETVAVLEPGELRITQATREDLHIYYIVWRVAGEELYSLEVHRCFSEVSP